MLDPVTRGLLEKTIGETKDLIPTVKGIGIPKGMQIQKDEDYILGWAIGYIMGRFLTFFIISYNRPPNEQELKEAREAIFYRTNELREAISKVEWTLDEWLSSLAVGSKQIKTKSFPIAHLDYRIWTLAFLMAGTLLTVGVTSMVPAAYAGGDDGNKNKAVRA